MNIFLYYRIYSFKCENEQIILTRIDTEVHVHTPIKIEFNLNSEKM
jgi:hypothetical protein